MLCTFSICLNSSWHLEGKKGNWRDVAYRIKDKVREAMHKKKNTQSLCKLCLLLFLQSVKTQVTLFLEDVYPQPIWT